MKTLLIRFAMVWAMVMGSMPALADIVSYNFNIDTQTVNKAGKDVVALTVGGGIPGPTIKAKLGDTLRVTFHNKMDVESSIHWHGILLPPEQDGVPWLNTRPIAPHSSHTFEFDITHAGTYWYHSHTGLQEQRGVYGSIVLEDPNETRSYDYDMVLVFSDWTNENPQDVMRHLKRDGDYYALKKDSVQSWDKVIAHGMPAIKSRLNGAWSRMGPMDLSDVGYDAFLANGEVAHTLGHAMPGDKIRVRMINAAASSYFNVEFAGGPMTLIAADGMDIQPQPVKRLRMAIAETWDAIITIPENGLYEIRATANDGTGYASAFIGMGQKVMAPTVPRPNLFMQDHSMHNMGNMASMDHGDMDHSSINMAPNKSQTHGQMDHSQMNHDAMSHDTKPMAKMDHSQMNHDAMSHDTKPMAKMDHSQMNHDAMSHDTKPMAKMDHSKMNHDAMSHDTKPMAKMDHSQMNHGAMPHTEHDMMSTEKALPSVIDYLDTYAPLKAPASTRYDDAMPVREVTLNLTGNMERYIWSFNDKTLSESDRILIRKGERVRFVFVNETMMNHPLHLHGHFFRVLNGQGDFSPLKHTVNVPSMGRVVIEFAANEEADWFFHCHNLYHMKAGMTRVISYEGSSKVDNKLIAKLSTDDHFYPYADIAAASHMTSGRLWAVNNRYMGEVEWEYDYKDQYEIDARVERFYGRYMEAFVGVDIEAHEKQVLRNGDEIHHETNDEVRAYIGGALVLPLLIDSEVRVDHKGHVRLSFGSDLQLTDRTKLMWQWNTDNEYQVDLEYAFMKSMSVIAGHNSKYGTGVGLLVKF